METINPTVMMSSILQWIGDVITVLSSFSFFVYDVVVCCSFYALVILLFLLFYFIIIFFY